MSTNRPPACNHAYKNFKPLDKRMARGGYAPGEYFVKCWKCECGFTGDKRAYECADCAYAGSNRPPSCDLPPEFYQKYPMLKPCPICGSDPKLGKYGTWVDISCCFTIDIQKSDYLSFDERDTWDSEMHMYSKEAEEKCLGIVVGQWNSIPRRSDVMELLSLVDEVVSWDEAIIDTHNFPEDGLAMAHDFKKLQAYADKLRKETGL